MLYLNREQLSAVRTHFGHTVDELKEKINQYPPQKDFRVDSFKERGLEYDMGRIRYFVENPEAIDPICVSENSHEEKTDGSKTYWLNNGYHRFAAACVLGLEKIPAVIDPGNDRPITDECQNDYV